MSNVIKSLKNTLPAEEELERKLKEASIFLGKLLLLGLLFRAIIVFRPDTYFLQAKLASITASLLSILGINLDVQGTLLVGENTSYIVNQDCLGWKSMFAFTGLILASAKDISKEIKFILGGLGAIIIINLIRVVTTVYLSHKNIISFEIIHTLFWKWGLTFIVFILWASWLYGAGSKIKGTFKYQSSKS